MNSENKTSLPLTQTDNGRALPVMEHFYTLPWW